MFSLAIIDLDAFEIIPYAPIYPLLGWLRKDVDPNNTAITLEQSKPEHLSTWQAQQAFANVPEKTLNLLAQDLELTVREPNESVLEYEDVFGHLHRDHRPAWVDLGGVRDCAAGSAD